MASMAEHDADASPLTRRIAPRYRFSVPVKIRLEHKTAHGTTEDMSASGVRIEQSDCKPPDGVKIEVQFAFFPNSPPIRLAARVVRTTETGGFAACFCDVDWRMQRVLRAILPTVGSGRVEEEYDDTVSFSGKLVADLGPELHRDCVMAARNQNMSLAAWLRQEVSAASKRELAVTREAGPHRESADPAHPCGCAECRKERYDKRTKGS
jgi:hypothetical protein